MNRQKILNLAMKAEYLKLSEAKINRCCTVHFCKHIEDFFFFLSSFYTPTTLLRLFEKHNCPWPFPKKILYTVHFLIRFGGGALAV